MNINKTFTFNGATITVNRANVRSRLMAHYVYRHFSIGEDTTEDEFHLYRTFAEFMTQATVEGDLGFIVPAVSAPKDEMMAAFDGFMNLDGSFYDRYLDAWTEVNSAPGDPETTPDTKKNATSKP